MKEFNLADALAGKPVVTRDGRSVKVLYQLKNDINAQSGVICILDYVGQETILLCNKDGKSNMNTNFDLFMKLEKKKLYIVINKERKISELKTFYFHSASLAYEDKFIAEKDMMGDQQIVEVEIEV